MKNSGRVCIGGYQRPNDIFDQECPVKMVGYQLWPCQFQDPPGIRQVVGPHHHMPIKFPGVREEWVGLEMKEPSDLLHTMRPTMIEF